MIFRVETPYEVRVLRSVATNFYEACQLAQDLYLHNDYRIVGVAANQRLAEQAHYKLFMPESRILTHDKMLVFLDGRCQFHASSFEEFLHKADPKKIKFITGGRFFIGLENNRVSELHFSSDPRKAQYPNFTYLSRFQFYSPPIPFVEIPEIPDWEREGF